MPEKEMSEEYLDFFNQKGGYDILNELESGTKKWKDIENKILVSPRTLSRRISEAMELNLIDRVKLLRGGEGYKLTVKGQQALDHAREMLEGYDMSKEEQEDHVLMYFRRCPVCHGAQSQLKLLSEGRKDYLLCFSCGAKWHLKLKNNQLTSAKLIAEGADGQGTKLLEKSHEPDFWLRKALKGSTPWPREESSRKNAIQSEE